MAVHACFNPKKARHWSVSRRRDGVSGEARDNQRCRVRARPSRVNAGRLARTSGLTAACVLMMSDAFATDLSVSVTKAWPVAPAYDWTGFYIGGNVGLATGNSN